MKPQLLALLTKPNTNQPLVALTSDQLQVLGDSLRYPVVNSIPRLLPNITQGQSQTADAFGFKWAKQDTYSSVDFNQFFGEWLVAKYGFDSLEQMVNYWNNAGKVLDVGCGGGLSSGTLLRSSAWSGESMWVGLDISLAVDLAYQRLGHIANTHFVQGDALQLPFANNTFDLVFSEGVLHHTPSTEQALASAVRVLRPGGQLWFYVYRKKAPVREFTDDYIRQAIAPLSDEESWEAMRPLTQLAQTLSELNATITIEQDIPLLEIKAGTYPVQRFIYWYFAKLFWNEQLGFEENLHVNFDWYRPQFAHRQTKEQVLQWMQQLGMQVQWFHEQESGFTVRAQKA